MQAKKSCPFIHVASASSLRRLTTGSSNPLLSKAKQCPIMSQAISSRSISTSAVNKGRNQRLFFLLLLVL